MTPASCTDLVARGWFPSIAAARLYLKRHQSEFTLGRIGRRLVVDYPGFVRHVESRHRRAEAIRRDSQFQAATLNVLHQRNQIHAVESTDVCTVSHVNSVDTGGR